MAGVFAGIDAFAAATTASASSGKCNGWKSG
jgi:hypothetical protein